MGNINHLGPSLSHRSSRSIYIICNTHHHHKVYNNGVCCCWTWLTSSLLMIRQAVTSGGTASAAPAAEALRHFLVSNGGETGGWDARDHGLFLQWRSRFRNNRQTFVSAVCDTVPGEDIYVMYTHLGFSITELDAWNNNYTGKFKRGYTNNTPPKKTGFFSWISHAVTSTQHSGAMDGW